MKPLRPILLFLILLLAPKLAAHPMPHSLMELDIRENGISASLSLPLKEFQLVVPEEDLDQGYKTLIARKGSWLDHYLQQHLRIEDEGGHLWAIKILGKHVSESEQEMTGKYHELTFDLWLQAPEGSTPRRLIMHYDVIMHQLVTHKLFIKISRDWDGGLLEKNSPDADLGILSVNHSDGSIPPVIIRLDEGSRWKGFKALFFLGMDHISDGTDHLLFLLVLMLVAPLMIHEGRWSTSGGTRYSVLRLAKIATAFTIGHSLTLLAGSLGWLRLPSQPVEILIAVSILVSALHAIKPLFYGKEILVAAGFGLIHGLAFASTLSTLELDAGRMAISLLGFNLGIEAMQFFIILLVVPWLVMLSSFLHYKILRLVGATAAILASLGWIVERINNKSNAIAKLSENIFMHGHYLVLALMLFALTHYFFEKRKGTTL